MTLLSSADLVKVLEAITTLNSGVDLASLRERTLSCVNSLIPNDFAVFDGFDSEGDYSGYYWHSHEIAISQGWLERLAEVIHENPAYGRFVLTRSEETFRVSDLVSLSEFHKTSLYNDVYKNVCGDTQLGTTMRVSPSMYVTHSMYRERLDFTESEREMLRLVTPHLKAAFRNAQFADQLESERRYLNQAMSRGIVALDEMGAVAFASQLAERWLRKYFGEIWSGPLPASIREYVNAHSKSFSGMDYFHPAEPLIVSNGSDELKVTLVFDNREREVLIFLEELRPHTVADFERSGVTHREAEILYWIGRGKTDPEIARLLSISPRTVQKHIEHIFAKLGVETRTAAVMRSLELIS